MNLTNEQIDSLCVEFLQRKANLGCAQENYYSLPTSQRERLRANCQTWADVIESQTVNDRLAKIEAALAAQNAELYLLRLQGEALARIENLLKQAQITTGTMGGTWPPAG